MKLTRKQEKEILKIYDTWMHCYLNGDVDTYNYYLDKDYHFIGSTNNEEFLNRRDTTGFFKKTADQLSGKTEIRNDKKIMEAFGNLVFITHLLDAWFKTGSKWSFYGRFRFTNVLHKTPKGWRFIYQHYSTPDNKAQEGETIGYDQISAENLQLRDAIKRRTKELEEKNKELKIESALESVRSVAMGMKKRDDMLKICKAISQQLKKLGVKEIRNVQTAIFYPGKGTYMNYEYYAKHNKTFITDVSYETHRVQKNFAQKMMKGEGGSEIKQFKGRKLKDWYAYQKTTNQFADKYLLTAHSLNYYWYSLGAVAMGISTYRPLSKEELGLFARFRNVFELAYKRYIDIEKAEAQTREAQIEAALERVRSRTMGMQRSDELQEAAVLMFQQVIALGVPAFATGFNIWDDDRKSVTAWMGGQDRMQPPFKTSGSEDIFLRICKAANKGESLFVEEQGGEALKMHYKYMNTIPVFKEISDKMAKEGQSFPTFQIMHSAFFSHGYLMFITYEPVPDAYDIFKRFARVFEQTYTRFLDLQKAEAQAKEAQIEATLERVRSRSLAMQKAEELGEVVTVVVEKMRELDIPVDDGVALVTHIEGSKDQIEWMENPGFSTAIKFYQTYFDHPILSDYWNAKNEGLEFIVRRYTAEENKSFLNHIFQYSDYKNTPQEIKDYCLTAKNYSYSATFQKNSSIFINDYSGRSLTEQEIDIVKRFSKVFEQAYVRFLDLQKAEAQAKEAQIEASLEKVRAQALGLRNSQELGNIIAVIFNELKKLGLSLFECGIAIRQNNSRDFIFWGSGSDDAPLPISYHFPYFNHPIQDELLQAIDRKVPYREFTVEGAVLKEFGNKLFTLTDFKYAPQEYKDSFSSLDRVYVGQAIMQHGYLEAVGTEPIPVELAEVLKRFTNVIDLTYTRFLDLKQAEAQAREAKIEAALERVRSRTMGMQKSNELKEIIKIVYQQLIQLKIKLDHAGFVVDYTPGGNWHFWIADEQDIPSKITHPYFESVWAKQFNKAKEKGEDFFVTNLNFEQKNKFYQELLSYIPGLPETSKDFYLSCPGLAATTVVLDNIGLYIENFEGIPYTDEENNTLIRFGKVFQQTYTRFLDLQRSEAQNKIIQAENERKSKELDDARQLQLSMLPKELPKLPHLDIAVYMKTATEVGGDYYDYNVDADGTLTFVVGDATGHGMMSGMMVSIMKSFFISNKTNIELKQFFENSNNSIKDMHLGRLMMACVGVQITSEKIIATNAGMPSLIYFRNKSQKAGEFVSHNFPLGAMKSTKYLLKEINYEKGDTILLMSDGFAELKNENNEQYGYPRIIEEFKSVAQKSPNGIVNHLKNLSSQWVNGIEPDDDVTFVVIKVKS